MTPGTAGLALFVAVVLLNVFCLLLDYCLMRGGLPTITATARSYPPVGYAILLVELLAVLGLADHFLARPDPTPPRPVTALTLAPDAPPSVPRQKIPPEPEPVAGRIGGWRQPSGPRPSAQAEPTALRIHRPG